MKSFRVKSLVGALTAVVCSAAVSQAAMVSYTVVNSQSLLGTYSVSIDGTTKNNTLLGGIQLTTSNTDFPSPYVTVCTDILGTLYLGYTYSFDAVSFSGQTGIDPNWGSTPANAAAAIQNAAYLFNTIAPANSLQWQAMQIAVWEALYDTGDTFNLSDGRFEVTVGSTDARNLAVTYLNTIPSPLNVSYTGYLLKPNPIVQHHGQKGQALLLTGPSTPVPEPSTIIAGLLLLVPLGMGTAKLLRRRINA